MLHIIMLYFSHSVYHPWTTKPVRTLLCFVFSWLSLARYFFANGVYIRSCLGTWLAFMGAYYNNYERMLLSFSSLIAVGSSCMGPAGQVLASSLPRCDSGLLQCLLHLRGDQRQLPGQWKWRSVLYSYKAKSETTHQIADFPVMLLACTVSN